MAHPKNWLQWNVQYIKAVNSCDRSTVVEFLGWILEMEGGFTKKRFIWNWIRGKDFYKMCSYYVVQLAKMVLDGADNDQTENMDKIIKLVHVIMQSEKSYDIRKSFVWNVTKQVPLLMAEMLPYMSYERIYNILKSDKRVLNDDCLSPFIDIILDLRYEVSHTDDLINDTIQTLTEGEI